MTIHKRKKSINSEKIGDVNLEELDQTAVVPPKSKIKRFFECIFLIFLGLIVAFCLLETMLRAYQFLGEKQLLGIKPNRITLTWIDDPDIGKTILKPNSTGWMVTPSKEYFNYVITNKEGFYDNDHIIKKPKNTYRILFLGDSFVASLQTPLDQTFFNQLEKYFNNKNSDKKIEVITMGMGDTGTAQQYIALTKMGLKYKPDLVVSMFLTANDLKNNSPALQKDSYRPYFQLSKTDELILQPHTQYSQRTGSIVKNWFKTLRIVELVLQARQTYLEFKANHTADYPIDYHIYDVNYSKNYSDSLNVTEKLILAEKKAVEKSGGKYLLVSLANNEQVNPPVWEELKKTYPNLTKANLDLTKPDRTIKDFCNEQIINCLQMLPTFLEFSKANPSSPTHYRIDGHWNQLGTDLAAKFLINNLSNYIESFSIR